MENMLDMYLFETNSLLEQLEEIMLEAEKAKSFSTGNINEIFRIMHTIKGSSAMMEFNTLTSLAHRVEDLFFYFRDNNSVDSFTPETRTELFDLMFRSNDFMKTEVEKIENSQSLSTNIDTLVSDINTFIEKIKQDSVSSKKEIEDSLEVSSSNVSDISFLSEFTCPYIIKVMFEVGCGMEHLRALMVESSLNEAITTPLSFFPTDLETDPSTSDFIIENGFFVLIEDEAIIDNVHTIISGSINVESLEVIKNPNFKPSSTTPEIVATDLSDISVMLTSSESVPTATATGTPNHHVKQSIISVNLSKLDSLMAIVGEIVITESMVTGSPDLKGLKLDNFTKSARQLRKLTDELQDITMSIRMIPISGVFNKMNRIVRDMGQKLGKDVKLTVFGENTELDKAIVDSINDPLMHIVRNSMDHGIEDDIYTRQSLGKPAQGEIILQAEHMGSDIIITVTDDGKGMDPKKILEKAKSKGLLVKPEEEYTKKEIMSLILSAGFSTNEAVTEFSGRGVGMDVVKQNIEKVGGVVSIDTELGTGSCITLKIPLTLAIVDGMEVSVGNSIFTIPIVNIRQSFKMNPDNIIIDSIGSEIVELMGEFFPIIRLHNLYNIETDIVTIDEGILVWVESGDKSYCLFVDKLIGDQQVVVKPLPKYLNHFNIKDIGIAGCTILGDGSISIILDILNLHAASISTY